MGRDASTDELADHLSASAEKVDFLRRCEQQDPQSLEAARQVNRGKGSMASNQDQNAPNFAELLADQTPAPEQVVEQAHRYERVTKLFDSALTARERDVLGMTFGLGGRAPLSKTKIAELLRVSRERVRQIEVRALGKAPVTRPRAARGLTVRYFSRRSRRRRLSNRGDGATPIDGVGAPPRRQIRTNTRGDSDGGPGATA